MVHARATEVLVCYSLIAAAVLVVEHGRVVLDAPGPRSQPAERSSAGGSQMVISVSMADQSGGRVRPEQRPLNWRWVAALMVVLAAFLGLRGLRALQPEPVAASMRAGTVVVVGVTDRSSLTGSDRVLIDSHSSTVQFAAVSVRPRYIGDCAAAGWATLGAGRRTGVNGLCDPRVDSQRVTDWPQRLAAAAAHHGDATLGTLAASIPGCVAAVGPRAALAAARPDGTVAHYDTINHFLADGLAMPCPLTLVDPGKQSDHIITALAERPQVTLIVTGIGPPAGSRDPSLQALYVLPAAAGWLTSASTRRDGIVNLTDLTATLIAAGGRSEIGSPARVDGSPFKLRTEIVTASAAQDHLEAVAALSDAAVRADTVLGVSGAILLLVLIVSITAGRLAVARPILGWGTVLPATMLLTGAVPWNATRWPVLVLLATLGGLSIALTVAILAGAKRLRVPFAVAGAAVTATAFTVDAALGGVMEPGSMLNSRPVNGGRWYGFGNVTFAVYAAAALVLAGYLAHRLRTSGQRRAGLASVAVIGFGVVLCEGWPSMGADFGGVIALTPALFWLLLVLADIPITWPKLVTIGGSALFLVTAISWLDWRRGPTARTHLGGFFQRILDGDAVNIIIRKAAAATGSILNPLAMGLVLAGVVAWVVLFRRLLPTLRTQFTTLHTVAIATLAVAILGTALNDGGITIWYTVTLTFTVTVAALWIDRTCRPNVAHRAPQQGGFGRRLNAR